MAAVIGPDEAQILELLGSAAWKALSFPANFNCPGQIVVSGSVNAVKKPGKIAPRRASAPCRSPFRSVPQPVHAVRPGGSLPRPSPKRNSMTSAFRLIANVTSKPVTGKGNPELLVRQLVSPVRWNQSMNEAISSASRAESKSAPVTCSWDLCARSAAT